MPRRLAFALVALGVVTAVLAGAGASWDGAYFLGSLLQDGKPPVLHGRYSTTLVSLPVQTALAAAGTSIDRPRIFEAIHGLSWAGLSLATLGVALRVAGTSSLLAYAVLLSQVVACLPGQFFFVSDAALTAQVGSLLLLLFAVGTPSLRLAAAGVAASAFLVFLHPSASVVLLAVAVTCAARGGRRWQARWWLAAATSFGGVALTRLLLPLSANEWQELQWSVLVQHFWSALAGWPLVIAAAGWVLAALAVFGSRAEASPATRRALRPALYTLAGVVAAAGVAWASDASRWATALDYRRFVLLASLPVSVACTLTHVARTGRPGGTRPADNGPPASMARLPAGPLLVLAAGAAATLMVQATEWTQLRNRLTTQLRETRGLLSLRADAPWALGTPLEHWALPYHSLLLQTRRPTALAFIDGPVDVSAGAVAALPGRWLRWSTPGPAWLDTSALAEAPTLRHTQPEFAEGFWGSESHDGVSFRWARQRATLRVRSVVAQGALVRLRAFTPFAARPFEIVVRAGAREVGRLEASTQRFSAAPAASVAVELVPGVNTLELVADSPEITFGSDDPRAVAFGLTLPAVLTTVTEHPSPAR